MSGQFLKGEIPPQRDPGRPRKHPIDQLKPGEGLVLKTTYNAAKICCDRFTKKHEPDWKFRIVRRTDKRTEVWRVE